MIFTLIVGVVSAQDFDFNCISESQAIFLEEESLTVLDVGGVDIELSWDDDEQSYGSLGNPNVFIEYDDPTTPGITHPWVLTYGDGFQEYYATLEEVVAAFREQFNLIANGG